MTEIIGKTLGGRYRVLELIGRGGMGAVYRVEHLGLRREFALKLLDSALASRPAHAARFEREVHAHARIRSEHTVNIVDCDTQCEFGPYLVMELLTGQSLGQVLEKSGTLPPARVANVGIDACLGLAAVHDAGLVHRDLKPENLFVTSGDDGREIVKLLDFGVVKFLGSDATEPGALLGTIRYMAPEQLGGDQGVGPHSDVYALGVTLYECLAGRLPFDAETPERYMFKILHENPEPLERSCPHAPEALRGAIHRALESRPERRFASAMAFAEALRPFSTGRELRRAAPWRLDPGPPPTAARLAEAPTAVEVPPVSSSPPQLQAGPSHSRFRRQHASAALVAGVLAAASIVGWRLRDTTDPGPADASRPPLPRTEIEQPQRQPVPPAASVADSPPATSAKTRPLPSSALSAGPSAPRKAAPAPRPSSAPSRRPIDPELGPLIEERR